MPVMFCGYFDANLWKIFAELNYFYKQSLYAEARDGTRGPCM
jgi:hypothetical protein